ncbi:type III pantothenate kinase [Algoriphagus sp. AK58]|uniref:type III pantothenate kinase n=1 Tax=Algoriphagus sp. AK58 TaxID=1406877 RepID=UPI00164FAA65|nr:type III pantothenate kinase [Algoriphagus sp. AK58]MBC6365484.1 type III pantothenate kinase [Algoriphagus sp. AK58]
MKNLVIDIGNSRVKSALFEKHSLVGDHYFSTLEEAVDFWQVMDFQHCLVSSVRFSEVELKEKLPFGFTFLTHDTPTPLINGYSTPRTLGLDRLAAAVGAWKLAGEKPVLAIDMGSCITYELVDDLGVYRGGAISPGMQMRAKAMSHFTAKLPEISLLPPPESDLGDSTLSCMKVGIWSGVRFEMEGFIASYRLKIPEISIYICGGDSQSFESLAKDHIFVVPNLVLHGLNCILNHNVE